MSQPGAADILVAARRVLLDALDALAEHRSALVLVGAQAIYLHTGNALVALAESSARMSVASVTASLPAMHTRATNGDPSANACENFTFHGQQDWEMCRYNRFELQLSTGSLTQRQARGSH